MLAESILREIRKQTARLDFSGEAPAADAASVARRLGTNRSLVSRCLNEGYRAGSFVKVNSKPVLYFCREALEGRYQVRLGQAAFPSMAELARALRAVPGEKPREAVLEGVIGCRGSLREALEKCRMAVHYPPGGIPLLLHGPTGVGKSFLARKTHQYAVAAGVLGKNAPFVTINCAEYADNPELLTANLFGYVKGAFTGAYADASGAVRQADGGILFLDEVHRLSPKGQEKLFYFMDTGRYRMLGDNAADYPARVRFIFATTEAPGGCLLETFLRRIPLVVAVPSLGERTAGERREVLRRALEGEAGNMGRAVRYSREFGEAALALPLPGNVGELHNVLRVACARALERCPREDPLTLRLCDLPDAAVEGLLRDRRYTRALLESGGEGYTLCRGDRDWRGDGDCRRAPIHRAVGGLWEALEGEAALTGDRAMELAREAAGALLEELLFQEQPRDRAQKRGAVRELLEACAGFFKVSCQMDFSPDGLTALAGYLCERQSCPGAADQYPWERFRALLERDCRGPWSAMGGVLRRVEQLLELPLDFYDQWLLTAYFLGSWRCCDLPCKGVIAAHGRAAASSIAEAANLLLCGSCYEAFDMPLDCSSREMARRLADFIRSAPAPREGFVVLVDMGSLNQIHRHLGGSLGCKVGIINNVTLNLALDVGEKLLSGVGLERLLEQCAQANVSSWRILGSGERRPRAILTTCITGIGTAVKMQKLMERAILLTGEEITVIPCDFSELKGRELEHDAFQTHDVLGILGTANPQVPGVSFVALEELISASGTDRLAALFRGVLPPETLGRIDDQIVKMFSIQSVIDHLTFLNVDKVIDSIKAAVDSVEIQIGRKFSNSTRIGLYIHISCMIERLIKGQAIQSYEDLEGFQRENQAFLAICRRAFAQIEQDYDVAIPPAEAGYLFDIVANRVNYLPER